MKRKSPEPVVRRGRLQRRLDGPPVKTYLIEVDDREIKRTNIGFSGWELYGLLKMVLLDLEQQLEFSKFPLAENSAATEIPDSERVSQ